MTICHNQGQVIPNREHLPYIRTYTGKQYYHAMPFPEDICIEDIAHALSNICRFAGHCNKFYSVAQHSVIVSQYCQDKLWGLLHDASEAYCVDIPRPLKHLEDMSVYRKYERLTMDAICRKFDLPFFEPPEVKKVDWHMLATEGRDLFPGMVETWGLLEPYTIKIVPWEPAKAEQEFINRFNALQYLRSLRSPNITLQN